MLIINFILGLLPIIWLVIALCGLKWPGYKAALGALIIAAVEALTYFGFSMSDTLTSILEGFAFAMWPIVIVIVAAVFTYNLSLRTGSIDMIKKLLTITLSLMMIFTSFVPVFAEGEEVNIVEDSNSSEEANGGEQAESAE